MQRKIKFRGRRTLLGKESFWIYGYGVIDNEILTLDYRQGIVGVECEKGTIGQYAGIKDKNGVEIYEGDIIKAILPKQGWSDLTIAYGAVFYEEASFRAPTGFHPGDWVRLDSLASNVEIEVLGTRWDTPGLIERSGE